VGFRLQWRFGETPASAHFVGKLLLLSLDKLESEYRFEYDYKAWQAMERSAIPLSDPPATLSVEQQSANCTAVVRPGEERLTSRAKTMQVAQSDMVASRFIAPAGALG
jgi:hypothetical protein